MAELFTHAQLVNTFFPNSGKVWPAHHAAPADKSGVYVFSTYGGPLKENDYGRYGGSTNDPDKDYDRLKEYIRDGQDIVLYVGRTEARSLQSRLSDYASGHGNAVLARILATPSVTTYVRWAEAIHFETAMIDRLDPSCNSRNTATRLVFPALGAIRWEGRVSWQTILNDGADSLPDVPCLYAWTDVAANNHLNCGKVHYVGEAYDLSVRFDDYVRGRKMNGKLAAKIKEVGADNIFVRWTRNFQFEAEIIRALDAWLNVRGTAV